MRSTYLRYQSAVLICRQKCVFGNYQFKPVLVKCFNETPYYPGMPRFVKVNYFSDWTLISDLTKWTMDYGNQMLKLS